MNSTQAGDKFEKEIFSLLESEINQNRFLFMRESCKIYHKKGYYSKDRAKDIIFDISTF